MIWRTLLLLSGWALTGHGAEFLPGAQRLLFLGDSITYAGGYVAQFDATLQRLYPERRFEVLDLGLPSETVSGLSEEGHAQGRFPRPDLHERLGRVLAQVRPDVVFACYGMNDGIYLPLSEERFAAFRSGIERLHAEVEAAGARLILLTPPVFDPQPIQDRLPPDGSRPPYARYDEVLEHYSAWLLAQRDRGWQVIDLHAPMKASLVARRAAEPEFAYAPDGVHANEEGHRVMAAALLKGLGLTLPSDTPAQAALVKLLHRKQKLLTDAWLTACGHLRPGMAKGLPLEEAQAQARALQPQLDEAVAAAATNDASSLSRVPPSTP